MAKKIKGVVVFTAVILLLLWASDVAGRYSVDAKVYTVEPTTNYVTFELRNGNLFAAYCDGEYAKGDEVVLTMDDNATENKPDDDFIVGIERR